jgi:hypothetical protein
MITESPRTNNISDRFLTVLSISKDILKMNLGRHGRELCDPWDKGTTYPYSRIDSLFFDFNNCHRLFNVAQNHVEMAIVGLLSKSAVSSSSEACIGKYMQSSVQFTVTTKFDIDFLIER